MANNRSHAPFKDSSERREFETILLHRRRSRESAEKVEKHLDSMSKQVDVTISHEMKKILGAQAKLNNRIADLKEEQQRLTRWSSLPRIDEKSELWCVDPYPITFQTVRPVKLPDGGKKYPMQRRKSKEFEDLPLLSYETRLTDSPALSPAVARKNNSAFPRSHLAVTNQVSETSSTLQDAKENNVLTVTRSITTEPHRSALQKSSPTSRRAKTGSKNDAKTSQATLTQTSKVPSNRNTANINRLNTLNSRFPVSSQARSPLVTRKYASSEQTSSTVDKLNRTDKRLILDSPLSKRKLGSVLKDKQTLVRPAAHTN